jgi:hypothetical protein
MSNKAEALVWDRARAGKSDLLMLVKIADLSDDDGRNCWAEVPHLAKACRASRRATQNTLQRLEAAGEIVIEYNDEGRAIVLRSGRTFLPKWFIHVCCVCEWPEYQAGSKRAGAAHSLRAGRPRRKPATAAHSARAETRRFRPRNAQVSTAKCAETRTGEIEVPVSDPLVDVQAGAPRRHAGAPRRESARADQPEDNLGVVTKLAHEVLHLYDGVPDLTVGECVESIKCRCAGYRIAYDSGVVHRALEVAVYQRVRAGKSPVLAGSAGAVAARASRGL